MKTTYKTFAVLGLITMMLPMSAMAAGPKDWRMGGDKEKVSRGVDFCQNIDAIATRITSDMNDKDGHWDGKKTDRFGKISDRRIHRDEVRGDHREMRDVKHDTRIEALMAKADTDAERAAVTKFETTLNNAVETRRAAIDAAVKTFRTGVDNLVNGRFGTLDTNIAAFRAAMEDAIEKAKADCAVDKDPKPEFQAAVKAARDNFKTAKPELIKEEIKKLADARKVAVDAAVSAFKTTMKAAFEELKTAFGGEIE